MKKIALIDLSSKNLISNGFERISFHIINHHQELFSFLVYSEKNKNSIRYSNKNNIKHIILPNYLKKLFVFFHVIIYSDLILLSNTKLAWYLPLLKFIFRKKIIFICSEIHPRNHQALFFIKPLLFLKEYFVVKFSDNVIANQEFIRDYLIAKYSIHVDYIENGGSHVERIESTSLDHIQYPFLKYMYATSYYSGDAISNVEFILDAFKDLKHKYLVIIGNWGLNDYSLMLRNKYAGYSNIYMINLFNDKRKNDLVLSNSILFIQPNSSIHNNSFLMECMSLRLPVLAFDCINNKYLTEGKASYFKNTIEIKDYLENLSIEKMRKNAYSMLDIATTRYNWDCIIQKYYAVIHQKLKFKSHASYISTKRSEIFYKILNRKSQPSFSILKTFYNLFL